MRLLWTIPYAIERLFYYLHYDYISILCICQYIIVITVSLF
nr:MAG TPA: hypothetical protein [Caudoviricetes sp.]